MGEWQLGEKMSKRFLEGAIIKERGGLRNSTADDCNVIDLTNPLNKNLPTHT